MGKVNYRNHNWPYFRLHFLAFHKGKVMFSAVKLVAFSLTSNYIIPPQHFNHTHSIVSIYLQGARASESVFVPFLLEHPVGWFKTAQQNCLHKLAIR